MKKNDLSFIAGQCIEYQHIDVMKEKCESCQLVKIVIIIKRQQKKTYMRGKRFIDENMKDRHRRRGKDMINDEIKD